jgi:hypothetical protein
MQLLAFTKEHGVPYIPIAKARGFTARLVITFCFFEGVFVVVSL